MRTTATAILWSDADRLIEQGNRAAAKLMLKDAAARGSIGAMTKLAELARAEREEESHAWMDKAESELRPGDVDSRQDLAEAYLDRLGRGSYAEQKQRARQLLAEAAEAGDPVVQRELAQLFQRELILHPHANYDHNKERYEYWLRRAMDGGDGWAFFIHASDLFEEKKPVPSEVVTVLEQLSSSGGLWVTNQRDVDVLLRAIRRRAKRAESVKKS